jgi:ubiquinone/menaquinone biosynthesis C-methylase UbiE
MKRRVAKRRPARGRRHAGHHAHDRFSPVDFEAFVGRMLDPERSRWQQPARVLDALRVRRGQSVADIGAGPGFFTVALARAVGPRGRVYAVDPGLPHLERLRDRLMKAGVRNVTPVLGRGDDPHLPPASCDVVMIVNTYHYFPDGPRFLRRAAEALRPGGVLVGIDFAKRETPVGPPVEHRVSREEFLRDAGRAGLRLVAEHGFLPYQYFVALRPRGVRRGRR